MQLGIPTANIPAEDLSKKYPTLATGVYYGVVALDPKGVANGNGSIETPKPAKPTLLPAVLSIGYNPFYKNTVRSVVRTRDLRFTLVYLKQLLTRRRDPSM